MRHLRIRAHHLLCMQGFQGYGYSPEFSDNLEEIIERVDCNPDTMLEIVVDCDDICSCCPHKKLGVCQKDIKKDLQIKKMDILTLEKLGIQKGETRKAGELISHTNKTLSRIQDTEDICRECLWKNKCLWYTSRDREDQ